jgi:hypothetical protein
MTQPANATLLHDARFTLALSITPEKAWRVLIDDINAWWPRNYRAVAEPSLMRLDPALGGRLEEWSEEKRGVLWYTVQAIDTPHSMTLAGFIAPPFGGPALSLLRIGLRAQDNGLAVLDIHDSIVGAADRSQVESGWRDIFGAFATFAATQQDGGR